MRNIVVVDIDDTLWDFAAALQNSLRLRNIIVEPLEKFYLWNFWQEYMDEKTFFQIVKKVHIKQESYPSFPG